MAVKISVTFEITDNIIISTHLHKLSLSVWEIAVPATLG